MPIDRPRLFNQFGARHDKASEWRPLSGWKAPTKIPLPTPPVALSSGSIPVQLDHRQSEGSYLAPESHSFSITSSSPSKLVVDPKEPSAPSGADLIVGSHSHQSPPKRSSTSSVRRRRTQKSLSVGQSGVRIASVGGKGQGVFALRPFEAGTTILRERPFVTFQDPLTSLEVYTALRALSPDNRDMFWSFSGRGAHTPGDVDIAETNLIPLEGDDACGMFVTICRINHCCSPNARWIRSSKEGKMGEYPDVMSMR
jgi:hypothetical protein